MLVSSVRGPAVAHCRRSAPDALASHRRESARRAGVPAFALQAGLKSLFDKPLADYEVFLASALLLIIHTKKYIQPYVFAMLREMQY
jgi:hypothetical protein